MSEPRECHHLLKPLLPVVKMLGVTLGRAYEIVLHDVSGEESFIVALEHGSVTDRDMETPLTNFGEELVRRERLGELDYLANYPSEADDGRTLRSSVALIRDEAGRLIGLLCLNYDMTQAVVIKDLADFLTSVVPLSLEGAEKERFPFRSDRLVDFLAEARRIWGKPLRFLSREERVDLVRWLDGKGFFKLKEAIPRLVKETGKSRYTLYGDVRRVRGEGAEKDRNGELS